MDYAKHYESLIGRARNRDLPNLYVERHHVIPRCLGGGNDADNIVALTPEEHFVAHQLLVKLHPGDKRLVFASMSMTLGRKGNKWYGWLRRRFASAISAVWLGKKRKPFSDEHRAKISAGQLGRKRGPHSDDHKAKLATAHAGKQLTAEHRAKLAAAKKGKKQSAETVAKRSMSNTGKTREFSDEHKRAIGAAQTGSRRGEYEKRTCPNCGKCGGGGSMLRWHFDNCRSAA